ncbi:MAG: RDD family protein [Alphaproteobacteria bacterium]|jgi:uncharacterized RDD family membrane protein YckC|nr:RDD family protein [Candidatus Jidaibacter sp.]
MENNEQVVTYASLNKRVIAAAIDLFILMMIMYVVATPLQNLVYQGKDFTSVIESIQKTTEGQEIVDLGEVINALSKDGFLYRYLILQASIIFVMAIYTAFFWIKYDATPGKLVLGCKIADAKTLERATALQKVVRLLGYFISTITIIGFPMIAFTKRSEGMHDKIAGTVVINFKHNLSLLNKFTGRAK